MLLVFFGIDLFRRENNQGSDRSDYIPPHHLFRLTSGRIRGTMTCTRSLADFFLIVSANSLAHEAEA